MPLFGKPSFKAARKVPRRRADAGSTDTSKITEDQVTLDPNLNFAQTPLKISLGGRSMVFQNGQWVAATGDGMEEGVGDGVGNDDVTMKQRVVRLEEENNLLKYKVELLLDMLAVSHCDNNVLENEMEKLQKHIEA